MSSIKCTREQYDVALKYMVELRKEIVETQKIRSQMVGFKIVFITSGIGLIFANIGTIPSHLLAIPAFAAIFFDFLINSYSYSIQRIGQYCRNHVEPIIENYCQWPKPPYRLWEDYMKDFKGRKNLSFIGPFIGNLGITSLTVALAVFVLFNPFSFIPSIPAIGLCFSSFVGTYTHLTYQKPLLATLNFEGGQKQT